MCLFYDEFQLIPISLTKILDHLYQIVNSHSANFIQILSKICLTYVHMYAFYRIHYMENAPKLVGVYKVIGRRSFKQKYGGLSCVYGERR